MNLGTALIYGHSALDDPKAWTKHPAWDAPVSASELAEVQKEIDSVVGTTRDSKSIMKVVWSGDRTYWKQYYDDWDNAGNPLGGVQLRPHLLYKSMYQGATFVRDSFVPRYVLLIRIEPEQYADNWTRDSFVYCPIRQRKIPIRPIEPPKDWYLWYATIATHDSFCCGRAYKAGAACYGAKYAHPRAAVERLQNDRKGLEKSGKRENNPFASPKEVGLRVAVESRMNNYAEQAAERAANSFVAISADLPLSGAPLSLLAGGPTIAKLRHEAKERAKRAAEVLVNRARSSQRS